MKLTINSKPFGAIEIDEKQILDFPNGLLGFEKYSRFALIEESEESPFKWLQSLDESGLAFILIQPDLFAPTYKPLVPEEELSEIGLKRVEEGITMVIVTIPNSDTRKMTANLQGPIVINPVKHKARQFISRNENHPVRKLILENVALETV